MYMLVIIIALQIQYMATLVRRIIISVQRIELSEYWVAVEWNEQRGQIKLDRDADAGIEFLLPGEFSMAVVGLVNWIVDFINLVRLLQVVGRV